MEEKHELICNPCNVTLTTKTVTFSYLGHSFRSDVLRCPECGQVFLSEDLVKGRMAEVEMELEDK